jgi:hypothetical protein
MKKFKIGCRALAISVFLLSTACNAGNKKSEFKAIQELGLKRGPIVSCGPPDKEFGVVDFKMTCDERLQNDFDVAVELLHSFEYDESEKVFASIIDRSPECVMAYWGVAMCNFHPLWEPPSEADLKKGSKAIEIGNSIRGRSEKETDYLNAVGAYYKDWNKTDARGRALHFESAMERLHIKYPEDNEAAIIYALALDGAADPADKTYARQKKAGEILNALYKVEPNHPGIIHYIIHTYDYPGIAELGLPAARRYAEVAPSSAHALHMPSHIFTRLGLWDDCIQSNIASIEAAKCYAESSGIKGHWDEELHGMDYLVYGYLQKGEITLAKQQCDHLKDIQEVYPINFKDAYAFAAIPARYCLENRFWKEAANQDVYPLNFPWEKFPWQNAIFHFTRLLGAVHLNDPDEAKSELKNLIVIHDTLLNRKDLYKANQVMIQIKTGEAWIAWKAGERDEARQLMNAAADLEDGSGKHPVTPGSVIPARELLGDLLMEMNQPKDALIAYESDLKTQPNRFNGLYGAALACKKIKDTEKATYYFEQMVAIANSPDANRPELNEARAFLKKQE